jgi:putative DNA methylase
MSTSGWLSLPLDIPEFLLFGQPIEAIQGRSSATVRTAERPPNPGALPQSPRAASGDHSMDKMIKTIRKKLIEVSIPLETINAASKKQKAPKGYPTALHKYWAQRPLAACRGVLFAQLVDDPSSWPDRFSTAEEQDLERRRLHKIIDNMVPWEASNDEHILNSARWEIARSVAWGLGEEPPAKGNGKAILNYLQTKAPPVFDPFSGSGSIPLEAQRLGLRAYGSDLNPVAVLIGKALVEIPPKFANRPPVNPVAQAELNRGRWNGKGAQGLAEDVRYYGKWMREEAEKRVGHLYPKAELPGGSEATVIAWLWARTVRSPDPAAKGAMVPLISSFMLSTKEGRKVWVETLIDPAAPEGYRFEVKNGKLSKADEARLKKGTKTGRGTHFTCILTGAAIAPDYVRNEGSLHRLGARLMAIVAEADRGRIYLSPTVRHEEIAASAKPEDISGLEIEMPDNPRWFSPPGYGIKRYADLFTPRQIIALTTLSDLVSQARDRALADARAGNLADDGVPLYSGGMGATAYADAIATYLAFVVDRAADYGSTLATWLTDDNAIRGTFGRQALPMTWDYCEGSYFGDSSAALKTILKTISDVIAHQQLTGVGNVSQVDASRNGYPIRPCVICTDPPYYDNIGYADLSDFFYVWLRRSLGGVWPDLFRRLTAPKAEELVATPYRHGGKAEAEAFFMKGMCHALEAMRSAATDDEPITIFYAFKQSEAGADGITSAGWASFLQAVVGAGLAVDGTWPLRTESGGRLVGNKTNALASSIVLVCRKRRADAEVMTRADLIRELKRELPEAINAIRKAGVGPVDMQQSVIGPGMGVFSRYAKVIEDDDSEMPVKTALSLINRVWEEIENELDSAFDAETQVALAWFATYGFDKRKSGELITLANAKNVPSNALFSTGVFKDLRGDAALTPREELPVSWSPAKDKSLTVWECVQHTARVLNASDGGGEAAARLVAQMGPKGEEARALAYRLFEIATQKGWAAEALIYNELAQEWPKLEDLASIADVRTPTATAQAELF